MHKFLSALFPFFNFANEFEQPKKIKRKIDEKKEKKGKRSKAEMCSPVSPKGLESFFFKKIYERPTQSPSNFPPPPFLPFHLPLGHYLSL